jgi:ParB-like nuclease family protein
MMDAASLRELADDIRAHGLRKPITLLDGKVLDGRNRHEAKDIRGASPAFARPPTARPTR